MLTRCVPPIPLETPYGRGMAEFVIDYGPDWHLLWVTFIDATGECRTLQNTEVRLQRNDTLGTQKPITNFKALAAIPAAASKTD